MAKYKFSCYMKTDEINKYKHKIIESFKRVIFISTMEENAIYIYMIKKLFIIKFSEYFIVYCNIVKIFKDKIITELYFFLNVSNSMNSSFSTAFIN